VLKPNFSYRVLPFPKPQAQGKPRNSVGRELRGAGGKAPAGLWEEMETRGPSPAFLSLTYRHREGQNVAFGPLYVLFSNQISPEGKNMSTEGLCSVVVAAACWCYQAAGQL